MPPGTEGLVRFGTKAWYRRPYCRDMPPGTFHRLFPEPLPVYSTVRNDMVIRLYDMTTGTDRGSALVTVLKSGCTFVLHVSTDTRE